MRPGFAVERLGVLTVSEWLPWGLARCRDPSRKCAAAAWISNQGLAKVASSSSRSTSIRDRKARMRSRRASGPLARQRPHLSDHTGGVHFLIRDVTLQSPLRGG